MKRGSAALGGRDGAGRVLLHFGEGADRPFEGAWDETVIGPPALAPIGDQSGVLQRLEMEAEPRLRGVEQVLEIADALLPSLQPVDDRETRLIGEGVEDPAHAPEV